MKKLCRRRSNLRLGNFLTERNLSVPAILEEDVELDECIFVRNNLEYWNSIGLYTATTTIL